MFQLSYSDFIAERSGEDRPDTRLEIDLESLEEWAISNGIDGEPFAIAPKDMLNLVREAIFWRTEALAAQDRVAEDHRMIDGLLQLANQSRQARGALELNR